MGPRERLEDCRETEVSQGKDVKCTEKWGPAVVMGSTVVARLDSRVLVELNFVLVDDAGAVELITVVTPISCVSMLLSVVVFSVVRSAVVGGPASVAVELIILA